MQKRVVSWKKSASSAKRKKKRGFLFAGAKKTRKKMRGKTKRRFHWSARQRRECRLWLEKFLAWSAIAAILLTTAQFLNYYKIPEAKAATYTFLQASWAGGATSTTTGHPSGQSGWTYYATTTSGLTVSSTMQLVGSYSWVSQTSGTSTQLNAVDFADTNTGWAVGNGGAILKTTDGGTTWTAQNSNAANNIASVSVVDSSNVWAAGSHYITKTTNGGTAWTTTDTGDASDVIGGIKAFSANIIYTAGYDTGDYDEVLKTTNGGTNWSSQRPSGGLGSRQLLGLDVNPSDGNLVHVVGGKTGSLSEQSLSFYTTNGGTNWTSQTPTASTTRAIDIGPGGGWLFAVSSRGEIAKYIASWSAQTSGTSTQLNAVSFADSFNGRVVGNSGTILNTSNGGSNWSAETSGTANNLNGVKCVNSTTCWAVGASGTILKYGFFYPTVTHSLNSSRYDAADPANAITKIQWSETLPSNTDVKFWIRTASSSAGLDAAPWCGPDDGVPGSCNSSTYFTDPNGGETVDDTQRDGSGDQWFQYKAFLSSSDGLSTPTVDNVQMTYVINAAPEFDRTYGANGISIATSTATSTVTVSYKALDSDTDTGTTNPRQLQASFEYSLNGGGSWTSMGASYLTASSTALQSIASTTHTTFSPQWFPKSQISGNYSTSTQIRVTITDNESYNYSTTTTSGSFTLDTRNPTSSVLAIDASSDVWTATASDNSSFQMNVSTNGTFSEASYASYNATTSRSIGANATGYIRFRDSFGNITDVSATTPETPSNIIYQDISNASTSEWREFIAWSVVGNPSAGFAGYQVYRSTDGSSYSQIATSTNRLTNYYVDASLTQNQTYYYKVITADNNGSRSEFSSGVSDAADGQGGTDITPPTISSVAVATTSTSYAQITWTTDEVSNSYVGYATATSSLPNGPIQETGVVSMVTSHSVYLTGLNASTTYYFYAKSLDASNNSRTNDNSGAYYSFTTRPGPIISGVSAENVSTASANIVWYTDTASDSYVVYSTSTSFTNSTNTGTTNTAPGSSSNYYHSVSLSSLAGNTKYYYYVKSQDGSGNLAQDNNSGNYYTFSTISDTAAPTISGVSASVTDNHSAAISWNTNEPATSLVQYGLTAGYGSSTATSTELVLSRSVILSSLTASTTYHYAVFSADAAGNTAQSSDGTFVTSQDTVVNTTTTVTVNTTSTQVISGGGGGSSADDITAPIVSGVSAAWDSGTAIFSWSTNENTIGLVELGLTDKFELGLKITQYKPYGTTIKVPVKGLNSAKTYYYRVIALDKAGNSFVTSDGILKPTGETSIAPSESVAAEVPVSAAESQAAADSVANVLNDAISKISPQDLNSVLRSISDGPQFLGGEPKVNVETNQVEITWKTDKESNSLITFARGDEYERQGEAAFQVEVGNSDELTTDHKIVLANLFPSTKYYFRLQSTAPVGKISQSDIYSFTTKSLSAEITKLDFQSLGSGRIRIYWEVNMPTDALVKFTNLSTEESGEFSDGVFTNIHDHVLSLDPNTEYSISVGGTAKDGKSRAFSPDFKINTGKDVNPPVTSHVKTESAFIRSAFGDRVQTIITWATDELAASQVFYLEGVGKQDIKANGVAIESEKTAALQHIAVISNFKPNTIYQFVVVSRDKAGNESVSQPFTVLTPQQAKSVLQLIIGNFENTFGWLKKLRF